MLLICWRVSTIPCESIDRLFVFSCGSFPFLIQAERLKRLAEEMERERLRKEKEEQERVAAEEEARRLREMEQLRKAEAEAEVCCHQSINMPSLSLMCLFDYAMHMS